MDLGGAGQRHRVAVKAGHTGLVGHQMDLG